VPSTSAEDGDPLDVLVLMDAPVFPGCVVPSRLVGVIEAEQTEDGKTERNDRLLAVAANSTAQRSIRSSLAVRTLGFSIALLAYPIDCYRARAIPYTGEEFP
jgi:inorganic pyrophosphatase